MLGQDIEVRVQSAAEIAARRLYDARIEGIIAARSLEHHDAWVSLINQAEDALQAMWNHFGDDAAWQMPRKGALVKCRKALATIKKSKEGR